MNKLNGYIIESKGTRYVADRATRYQARSALLLLSPVEAESYKMGTGGGISQKSNPKTIMIWPG